MMLSDAERNCWPLRMRDAREWQGLFWASPTRPAIRRRKKLQRMRGAFMRPKSSFRMPVFNAAARLNRRDHQAHN